MKLAVPLFACKYYINKNNCFVLQNSRAPLQEYIDRKMLNGQTANAQNIEAAIDRMMEDATPVLEQACVSI